MIIKHYYHLLDHLIEKGKTDISLRIHTNASVYNPIFIDKILKFNTTLCLSIDAVGETAENLRVGTVWSKIEENIDKFLKLPIDIRFHITFTSTAIADVFSLSKYLMQVLKINPKCTFVAHTAISPKDLSIFNMRFNQDTIDQIDKSLALLPHVKFSAIKKQLANYKMHLLHNR
jgi:sulfatase maturation enzyme AslB (radical SAM superfamily)